MSYMLASNLLPSESQLSRGSRSTPSRPLQKKDPGMRVKNGLNCDYRSNSHPDDGPSESPARRLAARQPAQRPPVVRLERIRRSELRLLGQFRPEHPAQARLHRLGLQSDAEFQGGRARRATIPD